LFILTVFPDLLAIRCHEQFIEQRRFSGVFVNPVDHGLVADFEENLARKPLRTESGGNDRYYFGVAFDTHFSFSRDGSLLSHMNAGLAPGLFAIFHLPFLIFHCFTALLPLPSNGKWQMGNGK
jgi:hypothetical protein